MATETRGPRSRGPTPTRETTLALVTEVEKLLGSFSSPSEATARLRRAAEVAHLITPARQVGMVPDGTAVSLSMVLVDPKRDTYVQANGEHALLKPTLDRICLAAGIDWDPHASGRIDDAKDALYFHFRYAGTIKQLDGREQTLLAHTEFDLRPGSEARADLYARQLQKTRERIAKSGERAVTEVEIERRAREATEKQIRELVAHAMRLVDSKCKNAAIRSLGLRQTYTLQELDKPFVVARLAWTGRSNDPATQQLFNRMTAESFLGSRRRLYGTAPTEPDVIDVPASRARVTTPEEPPPPDDPEPGAEPADAAQDAPGAAAPQDEAPPEEPEGDGFDPHNAPPMDWKGKPFSLPAYEGEPKIDVADCTDADMDRLAYWIDRNEQELADGQIEPKFVAYNTAKLEAMRWKLRSLEPW